MRKIINFLVSTGTTAFLFFIYALSMIIATIIEKLYSFNTAKAVIYESFWFEGIMLFLIINLIGNILKFNFWKKRKFPLLLFHLGFVLIFIGGFLSRYFGIYGSLRIRENEIKNNIFSKNNYIKIKIYDKNNKQSYQDKYLFTNFHKNYNGNFLFKNQLFTFKVLDYIPKIKKIFFEKPKEKKIIKIILIKNKKIIEYFLNMGEEIVLDKNLLINLKNKSNLKKSNLFSKKRINIISSGKEFYIKFPYNSSYINLFNKNNHYLKKKFKEDVFLKKNILYKLKLKTLYKINDLYILFPNFPKEGKVKYISNYNNPNPNLPDFFVFDISTKNNHKIISFFKEGSSFKKKLCLDNKNIEIKYGHKMISLPFSICLKKFNLKNYPGSNNPSSFYSELKILDNNQEKNYKIFMNNILNYKGYRFFQSGYDKDGKGTYLLVNYDFFGCKITYIGYIFLSIGMILNFFWKKNRFEKLNKKLKNIS
jgi:hypothetical protein